MLRNIMVAMPQSSSLIRSIRCSAAVLHLLVFLSASPSSCVYAAFSTPFTSSKAPSGATEECILDTNNDEHVDPGTCLSAAGYTKATSSFVAVTQVFVAEIERLNTRFASFEDASNNNMIKFNKRHNKRHKCFQPPCHEESTHRANIQYNKLISDEELVLIDTIRKPGMKSVSRAFHLAGPRKVLHFDPSKVNAAIVTCGGLCPGLNNVIRELVHSLYYLYGASKVYGITGGFNGFHQAEYPPVLLTNEMVENIHHEGGTILRSARGGFDLDAILAFLKEKDIQQLYVIGGDGTHRGAYDISDACLRSEMNVAVAGIPKTIDNDLDYIDRSFGFSSAVEAAQAGIRTAKTEAMCNVPNGIGIVKLMGRSAGFLAAFAALGSGDVDLVLVPEIPIVLDGPDSILSFLRSRVKEQGFAVVVVAEGAGEDILGVSEVLDSGGNRARPQIGEFITKAIADHFESFGEVATVKYIDPSYTVRSVPANGADSLYCLQLAQNAVHGAMAGMTGFSVGLVNNVIVYLPIPQLVATSPRSMSPYGTIWERILAMTGQPNNMPPRMRMNVMDDETDIDNFDLQEPTLR